MKLSELRNMRVLVWGAAREGTEAAKILVHQNCSISFVSDQPTSDAATQSAAEKFHTDVLTPDQILDRNPDFIVRSPGVSRYRAELEGFASSSLLALWMADQDPHRIIGVTGTKGKSTTSTLIANILQAAGHTVELAGNIGVPVTQTSLTSDFIVVEISSYQASDCTTSPSIAVITSLDIDHIPWHQSIENYHRDKLNLVAYPELRHIVFHQGNKNLDNRLEALGVTTRRFGNSNHSVHVALATPQGEEVQKRMGNTTFPRNLELAMDAALAADPSLTLSHVLTALDSTYPLPSRQQIVGDVNKRVFVDDALASNPLGVIAAIERFDSSRFILIMGGEDRKVDYSPLCEAINSSQHLSGIVFLGDSHSRFYKALLTTKAPIRPAQSEDVADAVSVAMDMSRPGDAIIFSPGAPTPRGLGDYQTRSARFLAGIGRIENS